MLIKKTLTAVAVDSFKDYLKENVEKVKQLDLDQNGQKDVDQIAELLIRVSTKVKDSIESTDFSKLATGLEQIMSGASLIGASVDRKKFEEAFAEFGPAISKIGELLQLGVQEMKQVEQHNR